MLSPFVRHFVDPLVQDPRILGGLDKLSAQALTTGVVDSGRKQKLGSYLAVLEQPTSSSESSLRDAVEFLLEKTQISGLPSNETDFDAEQLALERALANKITVALYADSMTTLMAQCVSLEEEADWWEEVERSRWNVAWYLLQTLPVRVINFCTVLTKHIRDDARRRHAPFTLASLRHPLQTSLQPSILLSSLFPRSSSLATSRLLSRVPTPAGTIDTVTIAVRRWLRSVWAFINMPFTLTRHECHVKKTELISLRDQRALSIGHVSDMRRELASGFASSILSPNVIQAYSFAEKLRQRLEGEQAHELSDSASVLRELLVSTLSSLQADHSATLQRNQLNRPSRIVLLWPKLVLLPPLVLYAVKSVYASRESLFDLALEAHDTIKAFVRGWLLEPVKDILETVRARGDEGVIVRKESVAADLESLDRMTVTLAKEQLNYNPEQLADLSAQIKLGDITPVLKLYERDIRSPLKSVVTGTLLRTLFIQIQKAKVDIDQALFGIDKLLKSQELTFAFVGVAPAFGIVYLFFGYVRNLWSARSRGRFGGKHRRTSSWFVMRRVERLLTLDKESDSGNVSALTAGLLLVSTAQLHAYGERYLPTRSKLREGFLEDVDDLSNPALSKDQKQAVVHRMWRSWGRTLEWGR